LYSRWYGRRRCFVVGINSCVW